MEAPIIGEFEVVPPGDNRAAVGGTFKVPGLRNIELTGPYFHNGGEATISQVLSFYDRDGDFSDVNVLDIDPNLALINLSSEDLQPLAEFLLALTDERVRFEQAPFDHPQIFVPDGHPGDNTATTATDSTVPFQAADSLIEIPAVGSGGRPAVGLAPLEPFLGLAQTAPPAGTISLSLTQSLPGSVQLDWTDSVADRAGLLVQRSGDAAFETHLFEDLGEAGINRYLEEQASAGVTFFYRAQ